jgi:thymidine phosphorylase
LLLRTKKVATIAEGAKLIAEKLRNGEALKKFHEMLIGQGVNESIASELCFRRNYEQVFPNRADYCSLIRAKKSGYIKSIDALELGVICGKLGAGREKAGDQIFYEVGFRLVKRVGDKIQKDEPWLHVYHNHSNFEQQIAQNLIDSIVIADEPVKVETSIVKIVDYE